MKKKMISSVVKCPNHGAPLSLSKEDIGKTKGRSPCPVSGWLFDWEMEPQSEKTIMDLNGNLTKVKTYMVEGDDKP